MYVCMRCCTGVIRFALVVNLAATCAASHFFLSLSFSLGAPAVASLVFFFRFYFLRWISSCSLSGSRISVWSKFDPFRSSKVGGTTNGSSQNRSNFLTIGLFDTQRTKRQHLLINLRENCTTLTQIKNKHKDQQLFMHFYRVYRLGWSRRFYVLSIHCEWLKEYYIIAASLCNRYFKKYVKIDIVT